MKMKPVRASTTLPMSTAAAMASSSGSNTSPVVSATQQPEVVEFREGSPSTRSAKPRVGCDDSDDAIPQMIPGGLGQRIGAERDAGRRRDADLATSPMVPFAGQHLGDRPDHADRADDEQQ